MTPAPYGSKEAELRRTAEMLPGIAAEKGVYYVVALLADSGYNNEELRALMDRMENMRGMRKEGY